MPRTKSKSTSHHDDVGGPRVVSLRISRIRIGANRREHSEDAVNDLAVSIRDIGLLNPITVAPAGKTKDDKKAYSLVAGLGRLRSAERLGWKKIEAVILDGDKDAIRLAEISENLFRSELTVLERSEQIAEYVAIIRRKAEHGDHPGGKQPHDRAISKAARKLKLSRSMIARSESIAGLSPEAKDAAKAVELDGSTRDLLEIAKANTAAEQLVKIEEARTRKQSERGNKKGKRQKQKDSESPKENETNLPEVHAPDLFGNDGDHGDEQPSSDEASSEDAFQRLKTAWIAACADAWRTASSTARERFVREVLGYSAKSVASSQPREADDE